MESAIFRFTRRVLAFFRVNPAKSFNQPDFVYPQRLFLSIVGSTSGKPGETGRGGGRAKKSKNRRVFFSRYHAANEAPSAAHFRGACRRGSINQSIKGPHKAAHGQEEALSQHRHRGQQTLRHEATQAWGAEINQSINQNPQRATRAQEKTSQHDNTGSKPCVTKRRRLGRLQDPTLAVRVETWPLHDIAITNIVWCMA